MLSWYGGKVSSRHLRLRYVFYSGAIYGLRNEHPGLFMIWRCLLLIVYVPHWQKNRHMIFSYGNNEKILLFLFLLSVTGLKMAVIILILTLWKMIMSLAAVWMSGGGEDDGRVARRSLMECYVGVRRDSISVIGQVVRESTFHLNTCEQE